MGRFETLSQTSMKNKTLATDFDGVLHRYSRGWYDGSIYDVPMEGAVDFTTKLTNEGWKLIVFTTRKEIEQIKLWLKKYNFPDMEVTNTKPIATAYIDDRAIRFTNWQDVARYFI